MKSHRQARIAELIREELGEILLGEVADPRLQQFFITTVEPSPDLSTARVLVVPAAAAKAPRTPVESKQALRPLRQAEGFLRHALSQRVDLRRIPELHFEWDQGGRRAERVGALLERLRKKSKSRLAILLLCCLAGSARAQETAPERYEASATIMGSTYRVAVYGENRGALASAVTAAFEEARRLDHLLSNYREDSELSRINQQAAEEPVGISEEMADLLERCLQYSRASEGAFDITVGPLMKIWGFYRGEGKIPSRWTLWRTLDKIGYRNLELDRQRKTVYFLRSGVEMDPGGIGKGYAVDRMIEVLERAGIRIAMVSAGSSSIYGLGRPPGEPRGWYVRIRDPVEKEKTAAEVYLANESLSTSGSYEKFFEVDGRVYSHIMDPRTGMPAEGMFSVSLVTPQTIDSEAWTKAVFINGLEWTKEHLPKGFRVFACPEGAACGWVGEKP